MEVRLIKHIEVKKGMFEKGPVFYHFQTLFTVFSYAFSQLDYFSLSADFFLHFVILTFHHFETKYINRRTY